MKNLNKAFHTFKNPKEMYLKINELTQLQSPVRNFIGTIQNIDRESLIVETDLFPKDVLSFYTKHNLGLINYETNKEDYEKYYNNSRGGGQGDYSFGINEKINNAIEALQLFPKTKRAVITMPYAKFTSMEVKHNMDEEQKCLRELVLYKEDGLLHCTGFMRAQAAIIFPKNIHFICSLVNDVADKLKIPVGTYTHFVTTLVYDRE